MNFLNREKEILIELSVSLVVTFYYFNSAFANGGFSDMMNSELGKVVHNVILFSIFVTWINNIF